MLFGFILVGLGLGAGAQAAADRPALPTPIFGPNVRANSDLTGFGQHEPSLAVSRVHTNTVVVASKDYREGNVKHVWIDVVNRWRRHLAGQTASCRCPASPRRYTIQSDPVVMARDDGRIYVACLATNDSRTGRIFITWTDDDGVTWRNPSVPIFSPDNSLDDKDWFAIDNNPASPYLPPHVHDVCARGAGYVAEQHSTDGGLTWSPRQTIGDERHRVYLPGDGHRRHGL